MKLEARAIVEKPIPRRASAIVVPLRFRDFRLLWIGLLISNLGTWMQFTAMGYFIATLAGSAHLAALYLGFLGAARAVPVLLLSPIAGVVADAQPRRRTLLIANIVMSLSALALAIATSSHVLSLAGLLVISAVNAGAQAFDAPARQSWVPHLVDRAYVGSAIGLNSVAFNAPAVLGPAIAGALIAGVGVSGAFYVNAVATLAVVVAVIFMRPSPPSVLFREHFLASIRYGIRFLAGHRILRWIVLAFVVTSLFVRPYSLLLPAFIVNALHGDARALGLAISAVGVGGFGGALVTAYLGVREQRGVVWLASGIVMSGGVLLLGAAWNLWFALPILFAIGVATMTFLGASNTLIQMLSPDDVRGRAISVYSMIALGVVPLGALAVGAFASVVGLHAGFAIAGGICIALELYLVFTKPILRTV